MKGPASAGPFSFWLSYTGTDRDKAKITTKTMLDLYNRQVKDSGLAGLSVGLYKAGAGTLTLAGANTYVLSAGQELYLPDRGGRYHSQSHEHQRQQHLQCCHGWLRSRKADEE